MTSAPVPTSHVSVPADCQAQSLREEADSILGEARMVLPGITTLLGFQTIVVFQEGFHDRLSLAERDLHLFAMGCIVTAIALAMAPASYQRTAEPGIVSPHFVRMSSRFITLAMLALAMALVADLYVVARVVAGEIWVAGVAAGAGALLTMGLWAVYPLAARARRRAAARGRAEPSEMTFSTRASPGTSSRG